LPLNVIHNVGAAQVREVVVGDEDVAPTPAQLEEMQGLVEQAMKDGAVGLSSALIYPPGAYATTAELVALAKVAARYHGVYFTHIRNESAGLLEALGEAIRIGEEASIPVHVFHLKAAGRDNWPLMSKALQMIGDARVRGIDVTADIYPYIRNGIGLGSFVHPRHYARGEEQFLSKLSDPALRDALRLEIETTTDWENWYRHVGSDWDNVLITQARNPAHADLVGLSVEKAAARRAVPAWTMFFDLVEQRGIGVAPLSMNEEQKREALRAPFVMIDCDSGPTDPATAQSAHPRAFGTMARVLAKYVREEKVIRLEEAVWKMSGLAATRLRLYDRGRIAPGMAADLIVFDENEVQDTATFEKPLSYSVGFDFVLVNGEVVIDAGRWTEKLPGRILR
jgi:N-acyl-D-amino-acid deacylase